MDQQRKHTPGPWSQVPQSNGSTLIAHEFETGKQMNPKGLRLVCFTMARGSSLPEDEANAALIAAAPDLLAALEAEDEWRGREDAGELDPEWDYERMVGYKRREAIAKAEGR